MITSHKINFFWLIILLLSFVTAAFATDSTVIPKKNSVKTKESKVIKLAERLEQNSPDGKHTVIFTHPVDIEDPVSYGGYDRSDPYWKKIEIQTHKTGLPQVVEKSSDAYYPESGSKQWSPDGR